MRLSVKVRKLLQIDSQGILKGKNKMQKNMLCYFSSKKEGDKKIDTYWLIAQKKKLGKGKLLVNEIAYQQGRSESGERECQRLKTMVILHIPKNIN